MLYNKEYGTSPLQYLTDLRIARAKEILLKHPDINIKTAASTVGYEDSRYFSRIFKNETGMTPSAWAEQEKSGFVGDTAGK
ncbi:MAG TPA: helix-turn-helix transcriptional regulator [Candidatus Mediterraneibacter stercorigallinarum]|uniref:Helix-turn-helix transcriptional regulator n=1 Tax=Candidatus Mediterraneibacter stercorigallinarum TaxID=2838686 RepID=A0A9D2D905_9FIRM|nr:helix-turn-helix transcriptional regulator [Candidatus Mediterraneibacter stercorigallinarum]